MIKNITSKVPCVGTRNSPIHVTVRMLSSTAIGSGKNAEFELNRPWPKQIPEKPVPMPSAPSPSLPPPVEAPVVEIPGPIVEPSLPSREPVSLPPNEIPAPTRKAENDVNQEKDKDDVLIESIRDKGVITLNRPKALNALNLSMLHKIHPILNKWESEKKLVIMKSNSPKAFCAGGDVKSLVLALNEPGGEKLGQEFFRNEYTVNHLIGTYKVPYVALIDGITMGGGVGLSVHGKYRVATDRTLFAMPETAIGLFPDVGTTYFLPRLKGQLGVYLGLTGHRLKGIDVLRAGVATHYVPAERIEDLTNALLASEDSDIIGVLKKYESNDVNTEFSLNPYIKQIDNCFSAPTVEEIIKRLEADGSEWSKKTIEVLNKMSPSALKVTRRAIAKGSQQSFTESLMMEYRLACTAMTRDGDFYEGVRAVLIDKDQKPIWKPKSLSEVTDEYLTRRFQMLPPELELKL